MAYLTLGQILFLCLAPTVTRADDDLRLTPYPGPARITFTNFPDYERYASERIDVLEARRGDMLAQGEVDHYQRRRIIGFLLLGLGVSVIVGAGLVYVSHTGDGGDAYRNDTLRAYTRGFSGAGTGLVLSGVGILIANGMTVRGNDLHSLSTEIGEWKINLSKQRRLHSRLPELSLSLLRVRMRF